MEIRRMEADGLQVCKRCRRMTANQGGLCTRCLNGYLPIRTLNPESRTIKPRKKKGKGRRYSDEVIKRVVDTYVSLKLKRVKKLLQTAAEQLGMRWYTVQHIVSYYSKRMEENQATELVNRETVG